MRRLSLLGGSLRSKPSRTVLAVLSIAIGFTIFGMVDSIRASLVGAVTELGAGADRVFVISRISPQDQLPLSQLAVIDRIPGISAAVQSTVFAGYYQDPKKDVPAFAVDPAREFTVFSEFRVSPAAVDALARTKTGAIVGRQLAQRFRWQVGDKVSLHSRLWTKKDGSADWAFDIVGFYDTPDHAAFVFLMNYAYLDDERTIQNGTVSMIAARLQDVAGSRAVCEAIDARFANSADQTYCQSERGLLQSRLRTLAGVGLVARSVTLVSFLTVFFLCTNALAQSVRERRREFATLKVIGWRDGTLAAMTLLEACVLCVGSAAAGMLAAAVILKALPPGLGRFSLAPVTLYWGFALALAIGVACGVPQALRVARAPTSDAWSVQ